MQLSRFNIVSSIAGTAKFYIVNLLSGHADVLDAVEAKQLMTQDGNFPEEFITHGLSTHIGSGRYFFRTFSVFEKCR